MLTNEEKKELLDKYQFDFGFDNDRMLFYVRENYSSYQKRMEILDFVSNTNLEKKYNEYVNLSNDFFVSCDYNIFKLNDFLKFDLKLDDNLRANIIRDVENKNKSVFGENLNNYLSIWNENDYKNTSNELRDVLYNIWQEHLGNNIDKNRVAEEIKKDNIFKSYADTYKDFLDSNFEKNSYLLFKIMDNCEWFDNECANLMLEGKNEDEMCNIFSDYVNEKFMKYIDEHDLECNFDMHNVIKDENTLKLLENTEDEKFYEDSLDLANKLSDLMEAIDYYNYHDATDGMDMEKEIEDLRKSITTLSGINNIKNELLIYSEDGIEDKAINTIFINVLSDIESFKKEYKDRLNNVNKDIDTKYIINEDGKVSFSNINSELDLVNTDLGIRYLDFNSLDLKNFDYKLLVSELNNVIVDSYGLFGFKQFYNKNVEFTDKLETFNYLYDNITGAGFIEDDKTILNNFTTYLDKIPKSISCDKVEHLNNFIRTMKNNVLNKDLTEQKVVSNVIKDNNYNISASDIKKEVNKEYQTNKIVNFTEEFKKYNKPKKSKGKSDI